MYISTTGCKSVGVFPPITTMFWQIYTIMVDMWRSVTITVFTMELLRPFCTLLLSFDVITVTFTNTSTPVVAYVSLHLAAYYIICATQSINHWGTTQGGKRNKQRQKQNKKQSTTRTHAHPCWRRLCERERHAHTRTEPRTMRQCSLFSPVTRRAWTQPTAQSTQKSTLAFIQKQTNRGRESIGMMVQKLKLHKSSH